MRELEIVAKIKICAYKDLGEDVKNLIDAAKLACKSAYAPYSSFRVGAAVLLADGRVVTGNNQENVAYPSGICAERTALFYANAQYPEVAPTMIVIAAHTCDGFVKRAISPCGSCRQVLSEAERRYNHPIRVVLYGEDEVLVIDSASTLLPLAFSF